MRVLDLTVSDLASETKTSVGSVVRFCRDLDLRGYQDLKLRLAAETAGAQTPTASGADSSASVANATLAAAAEGFRQAVEALDHSSFDPIVDALIEAARVVVVGVGTSSPVAQDIANRLRNHGLAIDAPPDFHMQHVAAKLLARGSVCLAISHTGQTYETLTATAAARDAGATTIAITSFHRSPLTELCDHVVVAGAADGQAHLEARTSRLLHLAIGDAITAAIGHASPERTHSAQHTYADAITEHRM